MNILCGLISWILSICNDSDNRVKIFIYIIWGFLIRIQSEILTEIKTLHQMKSRHLLAKKKKRADIKCWNPTPKESQTKDHLASVIVLLIFSWIDSYGKKDFWGCINFLAMLLGIEL